MRRDIKTATVRACVLQKYRTGLWNKIQVNILIVSSVRAVPMSGVLKLEFKIKSAGLLGCTGGWAFIHDMFNREGYVLFPVKTR